MFSFNFLHRINKIAAVSILLSIFVCSCNKIQPQDEDKDDEITLIEDLPTEDQLYCKSDLLAYFSPNIPVNPFTTALKARFPNKTSEISSNVMAFFFDSSDAVNFDNLISSNVEEAYGNNASIFMYNSSESDIQALEIALANCIFDDLWEWVDNSEDLEVEEEDDDDYDDDFYMDTASNLIFDNSDSKEKYELYAYNSNDVFFIDQIPTSNDYSFSAFEYGLIADSAITWLEDSKEESAEVKSLKSSLLSAISTKNINSNTDLIDKNYGGLYWNTKTHTALYTTSFNNETRDGKLMLEGQKFVRTIPITTQIAYAGTILFQKVCLR